ncbi:MAG: SDR family NAD(P)-dependent oxidoreductase [Myxococcaceae bacterium]
MRKGAGKATLASLGALVAARAGVRRLGAYDLQHKVVLITGGSRGLGLELAREFGARGARVAICARDEAELERARLDLVGRGVDVRTYVCDVGDQHAVEDTVGRIAAELAPVDVLVNNAGVIQVGPLETMTFADFEEAMRVHFWGPLYAISAVLPVMRERRGGRIVNISSIGGKLALPHLLPYSASKFALTGLSEGLRAELAKAGVKVTTVCPGPMRTGSPPQAFFKGQTAAEYSWFALASSLPFSTMGARRAARQVVNACRFGVAEIVLSTQAKVAVWVTGLFAGLVSDVLGLVNALLPSPDGSLGAGRVLGRDSESPMSTSPWTALTRRAAARNNELT